MRARLLLLCAVLASGCGFQVMKAGRLSLPAALVSPTARVEVTYVKSGTRWTNVWIDVLFQAGSVDTPFDPREFELMGYPSQIALKPTFRTFTAINSLWGPLVAGGRDGGMVSVGRSSDPVMVRAGTTIQATIVFETLEGGSRGIEDLELLYRGMRLKVAPGTQSVAAQ